MKRIVSLITLLSLGSLSLTPTLRANAQVTAAPALMNFQGRLAKPDGTPVSDGTYSIQFSLYDAVTAGNQKWTQTVSSVSVKNGSFAVLLSGFPAATFNSNLWLEIKIGTAAALTPRQQMVSVAFAMKANTVPDGSIGLTQLAAGIIPTTLPPSGTAGGDLTGTYPNPLLATLASSLTKVSGSNLSVSGNLIADNLGLLVDATGLNAGALTNGSAYGLIFGQTNSGEGIASGRATGSANLDGLDFYTSYGKRMSITNGGNVGIGTVAPAFLLDIAGTAQMTGFKLPTGAGASKILTSDASGIGTWQTAPAAGATGAAGGDLTGTYPNPTIAANAVGNGKLASDAASLTKVSGGVMFCNSSANLGINIGINKSAPQYTLDVNGAAHLSGTLYADGSSQDTYVNYGYLNQNGSGFNYPNSSHTSQPFSVSATNRIVASEFDAFSDERIKNRLGHSDAARDLTTLLSIEITDYTMKDTVAQGHRHFKKVIAQQVEGVYPQAVTKTTGVIPDIYQKAKIENGWVKLATNLKVGDKARLITKDRIELYTVKEVRADGFRVEGLSGSQDVFVYGREVSDLRMVDYDALSMLNVSATQALYHLLDDKQKQLDDLKTKVDELSKQNTEVADLKKQLAALVERVKRAQDAPGK